MGSLNFGKQKSSSNPLSGESRAKVFDKGMESVSGAQGQYAGLFPTYQQPQFASMTGGDYARLEQNVLASQLAPMQRMESLERERVDQDLANRGIYASGLGVRAQGDVTERLAPVYQQAGAQSALQRYAMQAQELGQQNQFNQANANTMLQSQWLPLQYLQDLWAGTAGQVSKSSGFTAGGSIASPSPPPAGG